MRTVSCPTRCIDGFSRMHVSGLGVWLNAIVRKDRFTLYHLHPHIPTPLSRYPTGPCDGLTTMTERRNNTPPFLEMNSELAITSEIDGKNGPVFIFFSISYTPSSPVSPFTIWRLDVYDTKFIFRYSVISQTTVNRIFNNN